MLRQNRVSPFGELIRTPARGAFMGNRGCLHDDRGEIIRSAQTRRWITCRLEFKGRRRPLMTPGRYTELFFLDEATAFAAGHRPCAECRRQAYNRFRALWLEADPALFDSNLPSANAMDHQLQIARVGPDSEKISFQAPLASLPDAAMITLDDPDQAYLVYEKRLLAWAPAGYTGWVARPTRLNVTVLTPRPVVAIFARGYAPTVDSSAE